MAQPTDPNQTKGQSAASGEAHSENHELISIDQLDSMILSEDPEFAKELKDVQSMPVDANVNLDVVDLGEDFSIEKENPWRNTFGIRKVIVAVLPFLPVLWDLQYRQFTRLHFFRSQFKTLLIEAGPWILKSSKEAVLGSVAFAKERSSAFKALNRKMKAVASILILLSLLTVAFVYRSLTHGVLPGEQEFLIASLEEWSSQTYKYDADTEMDSFYDSPRTIQNIMSISKMIVNLRPSANSGPSPMAAMEFFLEGLSPEAIVEVKDRETEVRDLFQRTMESMSFDELDSSEGKRLLTEKLRQTLNEILTKGKIRRIFIKEAIIKP